jgi:COMPASS component SWD3
MATSKLPSKYNFYDRNIDSP